MLWSSLKILECVGCIQNMTMQLSSNAFPSLCVEPCCSCSLDLLVSWQALAYTVLVTLLLLKFSLCVFTFLFVVLFKSIVYAKTFEVVREDRKKFLCRFLPA